MWQLSLLLCVQPVLTNLCEPAANPSPSCQCTRLDFLDTYAYRQRFGNTSFAGANYVVSAPTFNENYDCTSEEPLQCAGAAFAVFNMKYVLELPSRIPSVFCYPNIRMFDMESSVVAQLQSSGELPTDDLSLHLTEVGCIDYEGAATSTKTTPPDSTTSSFSTESSNTDNQVSTQTSSLSTGCNCTLPPQVMTQSEFDYRYAWQFPKARYYFGSPDFTFTTGCQSVTMVCKKTSQKALMFFNQEYIISGNDIRDVATRFNLHCDAASATWKFDTVSERKFENDLGVNSIELTELGCATIVEKA